MGPPPIEAAEAMSRTVVDRNGRLLRAFTTPDGRWRLPVEPSEVDPRYLKMLMAFEDRRFYDHNGVDPLAFVRSGIQVFRKGRIISGGSTLTMQVARLLQGRHEKTGAGKLRQIVRAVQIEERLSKEEILRLYLLLAPFGGNLEGVRGASLAYFGKEPRRLSVSEAALLVALPQSPESRRLDRNSPSTRRARDRVLENARSRPASSRRPRPSTRGMKPFPPCAAISRSSPRICPKPRSPPHPHKAVHRTTLDRDVQAAIETLGRRADQAARARGCPPPCSSPITRRAR